MKTISLSAKKRTPGNAKDDRKNGLLPGMICSKNFPNENISMDYQEFRKAFRKAGESSIIEIELESKKVPVLVHAIQYDSVTDEFRHVDFHAVKMDQEIHTNIPVKLTGEAPAIKLLGGILMHSKEAIEVKCLPGDLVHEITVDISSLEELHSKITVGDIKISNKITILDDPELVIAAIAAPRLEVEKTEAEESAEAAEGEAKAEGTGDKAEAKEGE